MIAWVSVAVAGALPGEIETDPVGIRVVARGLVESWDDPAVATVYRSGGWLGGIGIVTPVFGPVLLDLEVSFRRLSSESGTLEIAPLSALVEVGPRRGEVEPYLGLGPTWTVFSESAAGEAVQGAKVAGEMRGGLRIDTGMVRPPMPPASDGPVKALEIELYFARRLTMPGNTGLALGAWRAGLGIGVAF